MQERYIDYLEAVLTVSPALRRRIRQGNPEMDDVEKGVRIFSIYTVYMRLMVNTDRERDVNDPFE